MIFEKRYTPIEVLEMVKTQSSCMRKGGVV